MNTSLAVSSCRSNSSWLVPANRACQPAKPACGELRLIRRFLPGRLPAVFAYHIFALAALILAIMVTQAKGALPALPRGENTENVIFQEDFSNSNLQLWTNIAAGGGKATIGIDPGGNGAGTWYPSVNSDGTAVTSTLNLPRDIKLGDGVVAVYARVRLDSTTGTYNNSFMIQLMEKSPNSRYALLQILPGSTSFIARANSLGSQVWTNLNTNVGPALGSFVDLRMELTDNGNGSMKIRVFRYNTATADYVAVGSIITDADLDSGIFNRLSISSYNGSGNGGGVGRAYFDSVMITQLGGPRATVPWNAYRLPLPLPAGATIQSALDTYQTVVLNPGDYSAGAAFTLRSGQRLYGSPVGTTIPAVTLAPGAQGAVLSTVKVAAPYTVTFPASATQITSGCVFMHVTGSIIVNGGMLQDNLFLELVGSINIDTSTGGYARNNRFIRTRTHASSPQLVMLGDAARNSYGNVFLWKNFLTPGGDPTNINNQADLTLVGGDAESWNYNGTGTQALWKVGSMGTLRIFGMNGGNHGGFKTGDFDVNADEFQLYNDTLETSPATLVDYKLGANNLRSLLVSSANAGKVWTNAATNPFRLKGFDGGTTDVSTSTSSVTTPVWTAFTGALPTAQQTTLRGMVVNSTRPAGQVPWEAPLYDPIPDPAGPNWAANRANQTDSKDDLQLRINAGLPILPGIYYISGPLKIKRDQALMGSGADVTAIIAKTGTFDMIVADDTNNPTQGTSRRIVVADLTLQGGKNGIHLEPVGTGTTQADGTTPIWTGRFDTSTPPKQYVSRAQYVGCYIDHVTFRNMQGSVPGTDGAGIFMDRIYALDNIFFGYVNFVNCDTGLKQKTDPGYIGGDVADDPFAARMMYMDKCVFYRSQFVGNRLALDLWGNRGSNLNAWINCLFQGNTGGAAVMNNYLATVFANCDFINNGGASVVSDNYSTSHVSCSFEAGANGVAMFGGPVSAEGCSFDRTVSTTAKILNGSNSRVFLSNCSTTNMPIGLPATANGMLINTRLGADSTLNQQMISLKNGTVYTLLPGTPNPGAQLLFGSDWSLSTLPMKNY